MTDNRDHPDKLGERLRRARGAAGLTQDQAATAIGVARTTLVAIEKGERRLKMAELVALAELYQVSSASLLQAERADLEMRPQFRRANHPGLSEEAVSGAITLLERLATATVQLDRLLGHTPSRDAPPPVRLDARRVYDQADDAALVVRARLGVGMAPVPHLARLLESELGFHIFTRSLGAWQISGVYGYTPQSGPCVVLNAAHPASRRQFTLGHELGHFMSTRDVVDIEGGVGEDSAVAERFANAFSASLLMPAPALRGRVAEITDQSGKFTVAGIFFMAEEFAVSREAMCRRLETLGLVRTGTWDVVRRRSPELLMSSLAFEETPFTRHGRLGLSAAQAYDRELLSEGQLAELLVLDRVEARELLDAYLGDVDEEL